MDRFPWLSFDRLRTLSLADEVSWLQRVVLVGAIATVVSIAGDAALAAAGRHFFTINPGFQPFTPARYGLFTFVGVVGATAAWPVVVWISTRPRQLYALLAVAVTLVLLLPDVRLFAGEPTHDMRYGAVGTLVAMHLWIAIVTYVLLVWGGREPRATRSEAPQLVASGSRGS